MGPAEGVVWPPVARASQAPSAKGRCLAIGSIAAVACLALATAALELMTPGGANAWPSLASAAIGVWWAGIAVFFWRK